jgi:hypothetical protein
VHLLQRRARPRGLGDDHLGVQLGVAVDPQPRQRREHGFFPSFALPLAVVAVAAVAAVVEELELLEVVPRQPQLLQALHPSACRPAFRQLFQLVVPEGEPSQFGELPPGKKLARQFGNPVAKEGERLEVRQRPEVGGERRAELVQMKREPRQLGAVFETPLRERLQLVRVEREPLERRAPAEGLCREGRRELVRVQRKAGEFLQFSQGSLR